MRETTAHILAGIVGGCATSSSATELDIESAIRCAAVNQRYVYSLNEEESGKDLASVEKMLSVWRPKLETAYGGDVDAIVEVNNDVWAELRRQDKSSGGQFNKSDMLLLTECHKQRNYVLRVDQIEQRERE